MIPERAARLGAHMDASGRQQWVRAVILVGVLYSVIGIVFGAFAGWSASDRMRFTWNLLSFLTSAVAFAIHIAYEHFSLSNSPLVTASHTSAAVAVGAVGIAIAANVHELLVASTHRLSLIFAFVAFPAVTAIPAFLVALIVSAVLNLRRRGGV